jgi:hypothetical protein
MRPCCPPGHGCNADGGAETCALELCRAAAGVQKDAALAVRRWNSLELARERGRGERECRFRRRAFERARDRALIALALQAGRDSGQATGPDSGETTGRGGWRARRRRPRGRGGAVGVG